MYRNVSFYCKLKCMNVIGCICVTWLVRKLIHCWVDHAQVIDWSCDVHRTIFSSSRVVCHQHMLPTCRVQECQVMSHTDQTFMALSICIRLHRHRYWHHQHHLRRHGDGPIFHSSFLCWTSLRCMSVLNSIFTFVLVNNYILRLSNESNQQLI